MLNRIVRSLAVSVCIGLGWVAGISPAVAESGAEAPAKGSYVGKPGDTLDKVVRAVFPNSPLRPDLLRDEITRLNPAAFTKGSPKMLMAGATLQLPEHDAVLNKHLGKSTASQPAHNDADARRHWVRYP